MVVYDKAIPPIRMVTAEHGDNPWVPREEDDQEPESDVYILEDVPFTGDGEKAKNTESHWCPAQPPFCGDHQTTADVEYAEE